jgi:thiosulfate/3-mercaptopyruvate sulfurtransferase
MMPPPEIAAACMKAFGIDSTKDHIVVYGQDKCPFLHRAWFQIGCMGHDFDRVHLLAGSLQDWIAAGGPVDTNPTKAIRVADLQPLSASSSGSDVYPAIPARNMVDLETVRRLVATQCQEEDTLVIDARSPDRFYGRVDEPRPGLMRGHMPGAKNVFFMDLLQPEMPNRLKPRPDLQRILQDALGQDVWTSSTSTFIATCGSGATACTVAAALIACGIDPNRVKIYDGSWCEWGSDTNNPVVTGEDD